jgi:hypothetical protein
MGSAIWIEIKGRPFKETAYDCCKILRLDDELDEVAIRHELSKLSSFFDWTEMARLAELEISEDADLKPEFRDLTGEPLAVREQTGDWFDSSQGLKTIQTLQGRLNEIDEAIRSRTSSAKDFERYRGELLDELKLCERFLTEAVAAGQPFRLLVVP